MLNLLRPAWLSLLFSLAAAIIPGGLRAAQEKPEEAEAPVARPLSEIEKDIKLAAASKNYLRLGELAQEAADLRHVDGINLVIHYTLRGEDYDLEARVFRILKAIEEPPLRAVIYHEAVKNPNFKTRIVLLGVVFQLREDPAAFQVLLGALKDPSRPVALTAVRRLREAKDVDRAVPALIEALGHYKNRPQSRMACDIRAALRSLTEASLEAVEDWRNYWEVRKSGGPVRPRADGKTRVVRPTFFKNEIESDKIVFIIDVSGSMTKRDPPPTKRKPAPKADPSPVPGKTVVRKAQNDDPKTKVGKSSNDDESADKPKVETDLPVERERLFRVKNELVRTIESLPQSVAFTVLSYSNTHAFIGDSPQLLPATPENKQKAIDWVKKMKAEGETWTDTAFERVLGEVKDADTVFLLSDGQPYRNGKSIPEDAVLESVKTLNRFIKARVNTIGFLQAGSNLQFFLRRLASQNDGTYTPLE